MEAGINGYLLGQFGIGQKDIRTYSPLALAYIGDGVYDLVIRSLVVGRGNTSASRLHHKTSSVVKAKSQAELMETILEELTPEEEAVYRRGRNAKTPTMAKNASVYDYRHATGFEALLGYLYLKDEFGRLVDLVRLGLGRSGQLSQALRAGEGSAAAGEEGERHEIRGTDH